MNQLLKNYVQGLSPQQKRDFAERAKTSVSYMHNLASGYRGITTRMAKRIEKASGGTLKAVELCFGKDSKLS